jgi:hypothetical protein
MQLLRHFRIVIPRPPKRRLSILNATVSGWFDIKMRGERSFKVPTNQAFEESDIHNSYSQYAAPKPGF